jgi:hypothetical protein
VVQRATKDEAKDERVEDKEEKEEDKDRSHWDVFQTWDRSGNHREIMGSIYDEPWGCFRRYHDWDMTRKICGYHGICLWMLDATGALSLGRVI